MLQKRRIRLILFLFSIFFIMFLSLLRMSRVDSNFVDGMLMKDSPSTAHSIRIAPSGEPIRKSAPITLAPSIEKSTRLNLTSKDHTSPFPPKIKDRRFAYVFYATSSDYSCYALVNAHRLIYDLKSDPRIDIVIMITDSSRLDRLCPDLHCRFPSGRIKIKRIPPEVVKVGQRLTENVYYMESYVRLEAFGLYEEYDRIVVMDADGFLVHNVDHLFEMDLGDFRVAAALAHYISYVWISSVLMVVEPSKALYDRLKSLMNPSDINKIYAYSHGGHYDMDILNYALDKGNRTKLIPKYYALLDSYFFTDGDQTERRQDELNRTYYMHFTHKKPLEYIETRPWPLEIDSASNSTTDRSIFFSDQADGFTDVVYYPFWRIFDVHCRALVKKMPTVPPMEKESVGVAYPDPNSMMEFINNSSDLIIVHM